MRLKNNFTFISLTVLKLVFILTRRTLTDAHSFLSVPQGDYQIFKKKACRMGGPPPKGNDSCPGPCFDKSTFYYDKNAKNTTTFRRGQRTNILWSRNNHKGGFVRLTLVTADQRMNKTAHSINAFWYGCFVSEIRECFSPETCGSDKNRWVFTAKVTIPTCFEDGAYVLGWAWYGGTNYTGGSYFGDYYSCSYVLIKGGKAKTNKCASVFDPPPGKQTCISSVDKLGICSREPCKGKHVREMTPKRFDGSSPELVSTSTTNKPIPRFGSKSKPRKIASPSPFASPRDRSDNVWITGLSLVDAESGKVVSPSLSETQTVEVPNSVKQITFVATAGGSVKFMKFRLNGRFIRKEKIEPYAMFGDIDGELYPWGKPIYNKLFNIRVSVQSPSGLLNYRVYRIKLVRPKK